MYDVHLIILPLDDPPWMHKGGTGPPPPKSSFGMYNGAPYPGPPHRSGYGQQVGHCLSKTTYFDVFFIHFHLNVSVLDVSS